MDHPYAYPVSNKDLIRHHSLEKHFEGGYFIQTVSLESSPSTPSTTKPKLSALDGRIQSAWAPGTVLTGGERDGTPGKNIDANMIYYLLTPDSYRGKMHMNLHAVSPSLPSRNPEFQGCDWRS